MDWNIVHTRPSTHSFILQIFWKQYLHPLKTQSNTSEVQEFKPKLTAGKVGFTPRKFCQANKILFARLRGYDTMFFIMNLIWFPKQFPSFPSEVWPIFTTENSASQAGQNKFSFIKPFNPNTNPFCLWKVDYFLKMTMRPNIYDLPIEHL